MALTDNLVAYYKLDGNSNDSIGTNNGTDTSVTYSTDNGKINQGAGFNGTSSKIAMSSGVGITGDSARTMSFWAKSNSTSGLIGFCGFGQDTMAQNFSFGIYNSHWFFYGAVSTYDFDTGVNADTNVNFWTITYNGKSVTIYKNGSSIGSKSVALNTSSSPLNIGVRKNGDGFLNGWVDELGIWSRVLTTDEISELYNSGNGYNGFLPSTGGGNFFQLF